MVDRTEPVQKKKKYIGNKLPGQNKSIQENFLQSSQKGVAESVRSTVKGNLSTISSNHVLAPGSKHRPSEDGVVRRVVMDP